MTDSPSFWDNIVTGGGIGIIPAILTWWTTTKIHARREARAQKKDESAVGLAFAQTAFENLTKEVERLTSERREWAKERELWIKERENWHEEKVLLLARVDELTFQIVRLRRFLELKGHVMPEDFYSDRSNMNLNDEL